MRDILSDLEAGKLLSDPDPVKRAQIQMRTTLPKRFYQHVTVEPADEGGFAIRLDGKPVRTPAHEIMLLPTTQPRRGSSPRNLRRKQNSSTRSPCRPCGWSTRQSTGLPRRPTQSPRTFCASPHRICSVIAPTRRKALSHARTKPGIRSSIGRRRHSARDLYWPRASFTSPQPPAAIMALRIHLDQRREPLRLAALHLMTSLTGSALLALAVDADV